MVVVVAVRATMALTIEFALSAFTASASNFAGFIAEAMEVTVLLLALDFISSEVVEIAKELKATANLKVKLVTYFSLNFL